MHNLRMITEPVESGVVIENDQISFHNVEPNFKSLFIKLNFLHVNLLGRGCLEPIAYMRLIGHSGPVKTFELILTDNELTDQFVSVDEIPANLSVSLRDLIVVRNASGTNGLDRLWGERFSHYLSGFEQIQAEIVYESGVILVRIKFNSGDDNVFCWNFWLQGWDSKTDPNLKPCMS